MIQPRRSFCAWLGLTGLCLKSPTLCALSTPEAKTFHPSISAPQQSAMAIPNISTFHTLQDQRWLLFDLSNQHIDMLRIVALQQFNKHDKQQFSVHFQAQHQNYYQENLYLLKMQRYGTNTTVSTADEGFLIHLNPSHVSPQQLVAVVNQRMGPTI